MSGRAIGSGSLPSSCMHAQGRTEPIGVSRAGHLGCSGACQVGWVALVSLLRSDGRFDVAVFRGSVPVPVPVPVVGCLCLCLCSDETWGRERQAVGALSTLARMAGKREPEMQSECRRRNAALQRQMADRYSSAWFLSTFGDPGPAACLRARNRKPFSHTQKGPVARLV